VIDQDLPKLIAENQPGRLRPNLKA